MEKETYFKIILIAGMIILLLLPSIIGSGQLIDTGGDFVPYTGATGNVDLGDFNFSTSGYLNIFNTSYFNGSLMPITSLTFDIGSGLKRWGNLYVTNISADYGDFLGDINTLGSIIASGNVTADFFQGNILNVTYVNATNATLDRLIITDGTYTTTITPTTMTSDALFAPLLQLGGNSDAHGNYAVAIGLQANATGADAIAIGDLATVYGSGGVAIGSISYATSRSAALGYWASASGFESLALGQNAWANGKYASAIGYQSLANGEYSTALGYGSKADGNFSIAIGKSVNVSGYESYGFGNNLFVEGNNSFGFGQDGTSTLANTATFHNLNLIVPDGNVTADWGLFDYLNMSGNINMNSYDLILGDDSFLNIEGTNPAWRFDTGNDLLTYDTPSDYLELIIGGASAFEFYGVGETSSLYSNLNLQGYDLTTTGNVTADWFKGKFNWTTGDDWNTFSDGNILTFNSSKLSTTVLSNSTNKSNYWDGIDTFNDTQMEKSDQKLNIKESWLTTFIKTFNYITKINIAYTNESNVFVPEQNFTGDVNHQANIDIWFD